MPVLVFLLSSLNNATLCMQLIASEEDVWRGILAWGQAKAGVQSGVKKWTESDRTKMKQVLNVSNTVHDIMVMVLNFQCHTQGVLEHVRLMEIGSEVFAQEVEPTGLLSMEMTLARYISTNIHKMLIVLFAGIVMLQYMGRVFSLHQRSNHDLVVAVQMPLLAQSC